MSIIVIDVWRQHAHVNPHCQTEQRKKKKMVRKREENALYTCNKNDYGISYMCLRCGYSKRTLPLILCSNIELTMR